MNREVSFIIGDGSVTALAGGPLSLSDLGERKTRRVSRVEFNDSLQEWVVQDASTDEVLFTHPDYDVALQWEVDHFNRHLETVTV